MDPKSDASDNGLFASFYQNVLCNTQKVNNETLGKILQKNHSSVFFMDRSISFMNSHRPTSSSSTKEVYASIDEFREKVSLTTYDDYRDYTERMIYNGEKNLMTSDPIIYFNTSSGTTSKIKYIPMTASVLGDFAPLLHVAKDIVWKSLPSSTLPSRVQLLFEMRCGKKAEMFARSKDNIPIGPLSQFFSSLPSTSEYRRMVSTFTLLPYDLMEEITNFQISTFVQLVFAMAVPDIKSYTVVFSPAFIHTIKIIENNFEEISLCISSCNFNQSSLILENNQDPKLLDKLNHALNELTIEYGGEQYRNERANYIRQECLKKDAPGILHRLWPSLIYVSTTTGASEGIFGMLASIHTDEYFLLPTTVFFEFIKEEDVHQNQPKTLLISEIEPGNRYELVCTTSPGLVRYRLGDIIKCTRFLSRSDDLVSLPSEPIEIPRIPLISMAYRVGSLLDVFGEKTSEQHVLSALQLTIGQWKHQGIPVDIINYTTYAKLDASPAYYVIFLELIESGKSEVYHAQPQVDQNMADLEVDRQLCMVTEKYKDYRAVGKLGPLSCVLVRSGIFDTFLNEILVTDRVSHVQIKPPRLLHNKQHIQFFYDNQIN
ncbi:unnamed protein product [Adineta steineri]|uniref:Uncharacterized protein n=1 Tax=Adineta steineri TaxID=433720 RepID=A0A819WWB3_9BILA|nr:unnamed protein product [Adineta steineri]CAF3628933.1 unnamed protein product [Adineta steineri]CAF4131440.1 unnamed protein product [Adineta steineri]